MEKEIIIETIYKLVGDREKAERIYLDKDYRIIEDCSSMADVAKKIVEGIGILDRLPLIAVKYFDCETFIKDWELDELISQINSNTFIQVFDYEKLFSKVEEQNARRLER